MKEMTDEDQDYPNCEEVHGALRPMTDQPERDYAERRCGPSGLKRHLPPGEPSRTTGVQGADAAK
jgi:hypothetical protein